MRNIFSYIIITFVGIILGGIIFVLMAILGSWVLIAFALAMLLLMFILYKLERRKISKEGKQ